MNEQELVEGIDFATQAGDIELAEALSAKLEQARVPPQDPIERRAQNPKADQGTAISAQPSGMVERGIMRARKNFGEGIGALNNLVEGGKEGFDSGAAFVKSIPNTLDVAATVSRLNEADGELKRRGSSDMPSFPGIGAQMDGMRANMAGAGEARTQELVAQIAKDEQVAKDVLALFNEYKRQREEAGKGQVQFTDVVDGKGDFARWLGQSFGQGTATMAPLILAAMVPGVGPALGIGGAAAINYADVAGGRIDNGIDKAQAGIRGPIGTARPSAIEQQDAPNELVRVQEQLQREGGAIAATTLGYTVLDFSLGPVGKAIQTGLVKSLGKEVADQTLAQLSRSQVVKDVLKTMGVQTVEEALNEGGQEFLSILLDAALDGEDIATAENLKKVINAAAAGAVPGAAFGGAQRGVEIAKAKRAGDPGIPGAPGSPPPAGGPPSFDALPDAEGGKLTPSGQVVSPEDWTEASERVRAAWMEPAAVEAPVEQPLTEDIVAQPAPTEEPGGEAGMVETIEPAPAIPEEPARVAELRAQMELVQSKEARQVIQDEIEGELKSLAAERKADELEAEARQITDERVRTKLLEQASKLRPKVPTKGVAVKDLGEAEQVTAEPVDENANLAAAAEADKQEQQVEPAKVEPKKEAKKEAKITTATLSGSALLRRIKREGGLPVAMMSDLGLDKSQKRKYTLFRREQPSESGPLFFAKGRLQEDKLVEIAQDMGLMTQAEAEGPDAVRIAFDLVRGELTDPGSAKTVGEREGARIAQAERREREAAFDEMRAAAADLGIDTQGMTDEQLADRVYTALAADWTKGHPDLDIDRAVDVREALDKDEAAVERAAIEFENDPDGFARRIQEIIDGPQETKQGAARSEKPAAGRQGPEPAPGGRRQAEPAAAEEPAAKQVAPGRNAEVRDEQGAGAAERSADPGRRPAAERSGPERSGAAGRGRVEDRGDQYTVDLFGNDLALTPIALKATPPVTLTPVKLPAAPDGTKLATEVRTRKVGEMAVGVKTINTPAEAATAFATLRKFSREYFAAIVVDRGGAPLAYWQGSMGGVNYTNIDYQETAKFVASVPDAAGFWIAHNHPSGKAEASPADVKVTHTGTELMAGVVSLRGHVVIAGDRFVSAVDGAAPAAKIPPGNRSIKAPMLERVFIKNGKLGEAINSPTTAARAAKDLLSGEGIVLLNYQNEPIGVLPYDVSTGPRRLRSEDGQRLLATLARSGAAAAVVRVNSNGPPTDAERNLLAFLSRMGIRPLDVMRGPTFASSAAMGGPNFPSEFMSLGGDMISRPTFFSALERAVEGIDAKAMSPSDWKVRIKALAGKNNVKADEIEWSGINEWLDAMAERGPSDGGALGDLVAGGGMLSKSEKQRLANSPITKSGRLTKEQVLDYLRGNGVRVDEVVLGGAGAIPDALVEHYGAESRALPEQADAWIAEARRFERLAQGYQRRALTSTAARADAQKYFELAELAGQMAERLETDSGRAVGASKFSSYTLPGGTNYREVLLTLPTKDGVSDPANWDEAGALMRKFNIPGDVAVNESDAEAFSRIGKLVREKNRPTVFTSNHWDQPNVLAHIRLNDRTDADGNKVLFVEEVQSDWAQAGRKRGFKGGPEYQKQVGELERDNLISLMRLRAQDKMVAQGVDAQASKFTADNLAHGVLARMAKMEDQYNDLLRREQADRAAAQRDFDGVPRAPFVEKTDAWVALALKRILRMAADGGYDKVAFITGAQSADRYKLSNQVSLIVVTPRTDTSRTVRVSLKGDSSILTLGVRTEDGIIAGVEGGPGGSLSQLQGKRLDEAIGKDMAEKILKGPERQTIEGAGLEIGGEGMKAFYDKIVPKVLADVAKKVGGGKVGTTNLANPDRGRRVLAQQIPGSHLWGMFDTSVGRWINNNGDALPAPDPMSQGAATAMAGAINRDAANPDSAQPAIDITPEMRAQVLDGLPLFKLGDQQARNLPALVQSERSSPLLAEVSGRLTDRFGAPVTLVPVDAFDSNALGAKAQENKTATDIAQVLGRKIAWYAQQAGPTINGFNSSVAPDTLFVSVNGKEPSLAVSGHEFLHSLKKSDPQLYKDLVKQMLPLVRNFPAFRAVLDKRYEDAGSKPLSEDVAFEELMADVFGDRWTERDFWRELAKQNPSQFKVLARKVINFITDVLAKVRRQRPFGTEQYLGDLNRVREIVAQTMAEFDRRQQRAATAASDTTAWMDRMSVAAPAPQIANRSPEQQRAIARRLQAMGPDGQQLLRNLNNPQLADTPWAKQTVDGMLIRQAMEDLLAGRQPDYESTLDQPQVAKMRQRFERGPQAVWAYLGEVGLVGDAAKPLNNVNSSFSNCNPSPDCAKYCYATRGNYPAFNPSIKAEITNWAVESDPDMAAAIIARNYKATAEFYAGKALRLFDKGDGNAAWLPVVRKLNAEGVRVQIFSKNPEFLRQVPAMNVRLLSVDQSNEQMARDNPDLPIAYIYSDAQQISFLNEIKDRVQVILPVKQGLRILDDAKIKALPQWTRIYQCPIDNGIKKLGGRSKGEEGWNCTKCDKDGGIGCFKGQATAAVLKAASAPPAPGAELDRAAKEIRDAIERSIPAGQRGAADGILDQLMAAIRAGVDVTSEGSGRAGDAAERGISAARIGLYRRDGAGNLREDARGTGPAAEGLDRFEGEGGRFDETLSLGSVYGDKPPPRTPADPQGKFDQEAPFIKKLGRRLYSGFIDNLSRLQEVQKDTGKQLRDEVDAYAREITMHGRQTERLKQIQSSYIEPIQRIASKVKLSYQDVSDYLYAKHAPEANAYIASVRADMPDGGSGLSNAAAAKILAGFKGEQKAALEQISRLVQTMNREKLDRMVEQELITPQTRDELNARFTNFVSLKNLDDESILGASKVAGSGKGLEVKGKEFKVRSGRVSKAEDVLSMTIRDAMLAVVRSEKNRPAAAFARFVAENPNPALWRPVTEANFPMRKERNADGQVVEYKDPGALYREPRFFGAKINGEQVFVEVMDEELAQQLHKLGDSGFGPDIMGRVLAGINTATRTLSMLYTQLNVDFALVNPLRDIQQAVVVATSFDKDKGLKMAGELARGFPAALRAATGEFVRGELFGKDPKGPNAKLFKQFMADGGTTGGFGLMDAEQIQKDISRQLRAASGEVAPKVVEGARQLLRPVMALNDSLENMSRFAMYKVALENGFTRQQAAVMAKNVTVNFNKRGEANGVLNALYAFFNASIQGNMAVLRAIGRSRYARAAALGLFLLGALQEMMGEDDDTGTSELDYVSEFKRDRSFVIPLGDGKLITVPLAYGLNVPFAMGRRGMRAVTGREDPAKAIASLLALTFQTFSPIDIVGKGVVALSPTPLRPLVDVEINEDFAGRRIAKDNPFDQVTPKSEQYRDSANKAFVGIAKALNEMSGGGPFEKGYIDLSPEKMHYVFKQYTGGLAAPVDLLSLPFQQKSEIRNVPVVRRFVSERGDGFYRNQAFIITNEADVRRKQIENTPREPDAAEVGYLEEVRGLGRELDRLNRARNLAKKAGDDVAEYERDANEVAKDIVRARNQFRNQANERGTSISN